VIRAALLAWYRAERRDLPWRRTRDPYAIWVSETMLQQTRVEAVIPYYERFLTRFPTVGALASADLDDVLSLWAGLGYYSRARNLKRAAEQVVVEHDGRLPDEASALQRLPGIGRYTAGAIASIAFDRPEPIVDGNVARVLARLLGIREPIEDPPVKARLWEEAERFADGGEPGDLNQALMELGARVCVPGSPRCNACPVSMWCDAREAGDAAQLPARRPKRAPKRVHAVAAWIERGGKVLAVQRPTRGLLGGLWELPGGEVEARARGPELVARVLQERTGLAVRDVRRAGAFDYAFTHRQLRLTVYRCAAEPGRVRLDGWDRHRWVTPDAFDSLPLGTVSKRTLDVARNERPTGGRRVGRNA
jgi:A/G-specific adenine glycosylase